MFVDLESIQFVQGPLYACMVAPSSGRSMLACFLDLGHLLVEELESSTAIAKQQSSSSTYSGSRLVVQH